MRLATFLMLVAGGIWSGMIVRGAVERTILWGRMPIDQYVVDFRRSLLRMDPLQPILLLISAGAAVLFALKTDGTGSAFAWLAVGQLAAVLIGSGLLLEPINSQFRRRAEGEAPPNVAALRARWGRLQRVRVVIAVGAFVCLAMATTYS